MSEYTINEVAKITGIKAHTLRIWEKRYSFLKPGRTSSNIRFYREPDIELLIHVTELKKKGMRISEIAELTPEEIRERVFEDKPDNVADSSDRLIDATMQFDGKKIEESYKSEVKEKGFKLYMQDTIYPLLDKVSVLFIAGTINPSQEKFLYSILNFCMQGSIYELPTNRLKKPNFLLYGNTSMLQQIYIRHIQYLIKRKGYQVSAIDYINDILELHESFQLKRTEYIVYPMRNQKNNEASYSWLKEVSNTFDKNTVLIHGNSSFQNQNFSFNNIRFIKDIKDWEKFLEHLT